MTRMASLLGQTRGILFAVALSLVVLRSPSAGQAQTTDITSSGLNTAVGAPTTLPNGTINYDITGGSRPANGPNLFHSFGEFSVATNNIANFLNETALPTSNILSRVTDGNPSNIFGTLQTTNFGTANLYLINPAGVMFGPNASLNVGGSVNISTADYLKMTDGAKFHADPAQAMVLSIAPVAAFGFLNPKPAPIGVEGSVLRVRPGQALSLVGGDIIARGGALLAPLDVLSLAEIPEPIPNAGQINVISIGSPGEVGSRGDSIHAWNVDHFEHLGHIKLFEGTRVDATGEAGGSIVIRGGQLDLVGGDTYGGNDNTTIVAYTLGDGEGRGIDIGIRDQVNVLNGGGWIQSATVGNGKGGDLKLDVGGLSISGGAFIDATTFGPGTGGTVTVNSRGPVTIFGEGPDGFASGIYSNAASTGNAGGIDLNASNVTVTRGIISSVGNEGSSGKAGNITLNVGRLTLLDSGQVNATAFGNGAGGDVIVRATDSISITGLDSTGGFFQSGIFSRSEGLGDRGLIDIGTPILRLSDRGIIQTRSLGTGQRGGNITLSIGKLILMGGAQIDSSTAGGSPGANISIRSSESISIAGEGPTGDGTAGFIRSGIVSGTDGRSASGDIVVTTPVLTMENKGLISAIANDEGDAGKITLGIVQLSLLSGARIDTSTEGVGQAGEVSIQGLGGAETKAEFLTIGGSTDAGERSGVFSFTTGQGSGGNITVNASEMRLNNEGIIEASSLGPGDAGAVMLNVGNLALTTSAHIDSRTDGSGAGGRVTITANEVALSDPLTLISANSGDTATGSAGNIFINAATVNVKNGAGITSLTSGIGDAGTVTIKATDSVTIAGSAEVPRLSPSDPRQISTSIVASSSLPGLPQATGGDAGQVTIEAPTVTLAEGGAVTTTTFSSGSGGDVALDINTLTITNGGQISSGTGSSGDGGTVSIRARDSVSIVGQDKLGNKSSVSVASILGSGDAGSLAINSKTLSLEGGIISAFTNGQGKAGTIELAAQTISVTNDSQISSSTLGTGEGGTITIKGKDSSLADSLTISQSLVESSTVGNADAGQIALAAKTIILDEDASLSASTGDPTGLFAVTGKGRAGDIVVNGGTFQVLNGATVDSSTFGTGQGGSVTITATEQIRLTGRNDKGPSQITTITADSGNAGQILVTTPVLDLQGGAIFANTGAAGNAGGIMIETGQLFLADDALIASRSVQNATGNAGSVNLQVTELFSSQASAVSTEALQGAGGNVSITAGNMNLNSGTTISAKSAGSEDAGSIVLTSATDLLMRNSTVTTFAANASGGNIKLTAPNLIRLVDSTLISSVQGDSTTKGGNINLDPQLVVIQNSQILANADTGAGGKINIAASGAVLVDPNSRINASAGPAGISGTVNINTPIQVLSGALVPLNLVYSQAGLSGDRCAADPQGQFSSFVQTGRDGVPQVPGALSPSPLSFLENLKSGSLGSPWSNVAAARLGLDSISVEDSTPFRFHSACRS